jgi:simple sugar transport system ATP-binding protein
MQVASFWRESLSHRFFYFDPFLMSLRLSSQSAPASPGAAVFLEVVDVHKRFAGVSALKGVSLQIHAGVVYHLLGENGCGKSTLIKIMAGAQPPDEGELLIEGIARKRLTPLASLAAGIETVYQDLSLLPNLSVVENIGLNEQLVASQGSLLRILNRRKLAATAEAALAAVGLPVDRHFLATPVNTLPIATRQLIAIARAVACKARMVIMDEPTTALTKREVDKLIGVVRRLQEQQVAVLFVSHKLDECYAIGGEVIVMRDGLKVAQGPIASYTKVELARWMTGKHIGTDRYRNQPQLGDVLLQVQHLAHTTAFKDVSFDLRKGEILGITGLLDSGRNELALVLAGIQGATGGVICMDGKKVQMKSPGEAIEHGIGYVPEDRLNEGLFLEKSIQENIVVAVLKRLCGRFGLIDAGQSVVLSESTVKALQIATPDVTRPVQSLSGGNQQRVLIGRWLTIKPRVLILHGPTAGVDVGSKDTIYQIIQQLANEGLATIFISDDLPELLQNCDRILLMRKGDLAATFDAQNVQEAELYRALLSESSESAAA